MWAKICRPGSTYGRGDRENHVSKKKSAGQGFTYGARVGRNVYVKKNLQARVLHTWKGVKWVSPECTVRNAWHVASWNNRWLRIVHVRSATWGIRCALGMYVPADVPPPLAEGVLYTVVETVLCSCGAQPYVRLTHKVQYGDGYYRGQCLVREDSRTWSNYHGKRMQYRHGCCITMVIRYSTAVSLPQSRIRVLRTCKYMYLRSYH